MPGIIITPSEVYDSAGRLVSRRYPDGRQINYTYDPYGHVIGACEYGPGVVVERSLSITNERGIEIHELEGVDDNDDAYFCPGR